MRSGWSDPVDVAIFVVLTCFSLAILLIPIGMLLTTGCIS